MRLNLAGILPSGNIYWVAATRLALPGGPEWWFNTKEADMFLAGPDSTIEVIQHDQPLRAASYIAIDAIRFSRDDSEDLLGCTWAQVESARPVLLMSAYRHPLPRSTAVWQVPDKPVVTLGPMLDLFFYSIFPLIPPNHQCWERCFGSLQINEKVQVLESLPFLIPHRRFHIERHICVIAGIDFVYNKGSHEEISQATRFLRVAKKLFVTSGMGRILLVCRTAFNVVDVLDGKSGLINIDEKDSVKQVPYESLIAQHSVLTEGTL
ncbi:hypothetical protein K449DRAFT_462966 [Hypoxylon sp. EC38]|nr:hypothetical protein K449DRAFT_462966 [Hypoxylon sp. EC38]